MDGTPKKATKLRAGAVSYLNTKPLIKHLPQLAPELDLVLDVPSQLASDLEEGRLDIALIPSIEYFQRPGMTIIPGVSISSFGPVLSVKLCSRVPFEKIRQVSLDEGSRTSIALCKILLHHLFNVHPETTTLPLFMDPVDCTTDAVLIIGDRAMKVPDGSYPFTLDLGYEWSRWTGLPFVFAFWAVAENVELSDRLLKAFTQAKEKGRLEIPAIAKAEAQKLGIDEVRCQYYLEHVIRHEFAADEMSGLVRFYQLAVERGLAPEGVTCVFQGKSHLAKSV